MKIEEYNKFYHVDISCQIDNKWKNDSVLGIVKDSERYSVKIKGKDKEKIKERFIHNEEEDYVKKHNKKVVAIIYSYLLYKLLEYFDQANPILLCRDVRPEKYILQYLDKISKIKKNQNISNKQIKFRKRIEFETCNKLPKSLAGKYVRKVYQGKIKPDIILEEKEIIELIDIINKII